MIILGVECTAHTFGVGIIEVIGKGKNIGDCGCKVLANEKDSYSSKDKGMIPDEIVQHHNNVAEDVLKQAFDKSGMGWKDVRLVAYSAGPGLDPALWAGYHIVKKWAETNGKKLIPTNHCAAHLSIGKVVNQLKEDPVYLYVSGVNTQIIVFDGGKYRVVGETLDLGLGNMLDKFGRFIGLGFPAGPEIEQLSKVGNYVTLPYIVKGMDVSFSGILTKCQQLFESKISKKELLKKQGKNVELPDYISKEDLIILQKMQKQLDQPISKEDLCFSIQETCFAMLTEVVERALAHVNKGSLVLVGGVGANKRFCEMLNKMCRARGANFYNVPMSLAGDQGAMIAWEGFLRKDEFGPDCKGKEIEVLPHWRADEV
ncbi:tRNA (adenosine(37)-N6)-threonylcarbamoyltransferase complex transferase subunit TsaD [archaeon]|jgi:glycoprotease/Kae1 family metallohydrolase|nr:tRNA (adenosine(37)-N6)-threonylcarbamoyltransferase complex transferase subunit TsaD [archaeon]MBT3451532.1 tRNA (adenosine(37)-N6)-threonylcarbamoyltransferase complex transferase subunit TsaD [archaeon]MBT6869391.1 tRNA (adenosine(37)-N6)-threonylcarbamoyltransferase complex transferase subunit TsaD [archaeon]MBT7192554.1 tRNA (adenosine(37)-N6)-threonylcarbamoyltransferase complex transferase subunit TsaD [archaeon]MBT7380630.1 tRNA (adenosine(37)-N6)-threonylcarbamoyltransferase complex